MSDTARTWISGAPAIAQTGPGDMHVVLSPSPGAPGPNPRGQAVDALRWLARCFVHPAGFGRARDILAANRTIFLDGPPGSGRVTAAKMLLWELPPDAGRFLALPPPDENPEVRSVDIGDGDRLWLDLSDADQAQWDRVRADLPPLRLAVQEHAAHLAVVLPHHLDVRGHELGPYRATIGRHAVREVLLSHLRAERLFWTGDTDPAAYLPADAPLSDVPEFVRLVLEARHAAAGRGTLTEWCARAYEALAVREDDIAQQVDELPGGEQRALLFTAAMLDGAHADGVRGGETLLLARARHPAEETPPFARRPLHQRLGEIRARIDGTGRVRFTRLGYDAVVRAYFWRNLPELHDDIAAWVVEAADSARLEDGEYADLVRRFTERCLPARYLRIWSHLVEELTKPGTSRRHLDGAAIALQRGIRDEEHGREFRKQIYEWVTGHRLSDRLGDAIVAACANAMAVSHPDAAMVRLHHVVRRESGDRGLDALAYLAQGDRRFRRQLLGRLAERMDPQRWPRDAVLFLRVAAASALTDTGGNGRSPLGERSVRAPLAACWGRVFASAPYDLWRERATEWIQCAADDPAHRDALLEPLVTASVRRSDVPGRLYALTRAGSRTAVSELVLRKIDDAQEVPLI